MTRSVTVWNDRCDNDLLLTEPAVENLSKVMAERERGINKRRLKTLPDDNKLVVDEE